ncbi:carbohydrate ABC transporter permease [Pseudothermotoga thermarum]|uniref:Binding-protein-dependent transport systems inner membrane component n=1 Tax=Pseudothermotoga thermarum DSM 5069 TaxID=688269 RepID=F7YUW9_9THEM|nr:sugar ABC transporter permease [Pseudothermotoga thermarum]AEH51530.1 binding-protein-dependent transport systems inner membrane component [Pseudothermotoga thermarum DSM 5069]
MEILPKKVGFLFLVPALLFICLFLLFPFFWVIVISFTNRALTGPAALSPTFVGLRNYLRLFNFQRWMRPGEFGNALKNTAIFVVGSAILGQVPLGLGIALLLHRFKWKTIREIVYTLAIAAWILPGVPVAFAWIAFLDRDFGTLNAILKFFKIGPIDWYFEQPLLAIILFNIWRGTAFSMLLFSAALGSIPPSYWDISEVIGATAWQRFRDVIFPLIKPHILTDLILVTLWTFNSFTPYLITGGGPLFKSETIPMYTYREAFRFLEFGRGASAAVVTMTINLILAIIYLTFLKRQEVYK